MPNPKPDDGATNGGGQLAELRALLIGPEHARIERLTSLLDNPEQFAKEVGQVLGPAVRLSSRDGKLRSALEPIIEQTIRISVQRNPRVLADALSPIIGATVRKAVAAALQRLAETLNQMVEQSMSVRAVKWRLEALRTGRPYGEILLVRSLLYRVEQVFLIHRKTGLILQQRAAANMTARNADLISGMLTVIQDFVRDSFHLEHGDELETVQVGTFSIWVQHAPPAMLAGIVHGAPPPQLKKRFEDALERICREQADALENFRGDTEPFRAARPHMDLCLVGCREPEKKRGRKGVWILLAFVLAASLGWAFLWYRDHQRWTAFRDALRDEPGIVVTEARTDSGRYLISGLRDPLAGDPLVLAQRAGMSPADISFHWKPYESLEPPFVRRRLFAERQETIRRASVLFEVNSAALLPEAQARLKELAEPVRSLLELSRELGSPVHVEVIGHTDESGSADTNARLARDRARVVADALIAAGVRADQLSWRPEESDRLGRRAVSFHISPHP